MSSTELKSCFACLPRTERGKPIVIGGDPKGKNFLYVNGTSVIIRDIENPANSDLYTEHAQNTTCAKYAPSGFYIASSDVTGKVRIWDTTQKEHILKCEHQPLGGPIKDIAWDFDNKRIAVGGEGREKYAHCFMWDSGNSVGDLAGQNRSVNSVDIRQCRPMRIITGSEDSSTRFSGGPPFKWIKNLYEQSKMVNVVRFSPDGSKFVTAGSDGKLCLYNSDSGDYEKDIGEPKAHNYGIYGVCFNKDGTQLLTVSGDKTAKIWNISDHTLAMEFVLGNRVEDMQVGCLWQGDHLITVSLSGDINYLDKDNCSKPKKIVKGHNRPITALNLSEDRSTIFTGSCDAHLMYWDAASGDCDEFSPQGHSNQIQDIVTSGDEIITAGMDDTVRFALNSTRQYCDNVVKLKSQPQCLAALSTTVVVGCINEIVLLQQRNMVFEMKVDFHPKSISIHPNSTQVAVGGEKDKKIRIYVLSGGILSGPPREIELFEGANDIKYSPDGEYMAVGAGKNVYLYRLPDYEELYNQGYHTARVNVIAWEPNSKYFASGGLDSSIIFWKLIKYSNKLSILRAHQKSQITGLAWINGQRLVSTGQDSCVKQWTVNFS